MNGKDIFLGLKYVGEDLIEQAEYGTFSESKHRKPVRPLLIAALVALLLMLVGCAVVYALHLRDLQIGNRDHIREVFDPYHREIVGSEIVPQQVLTFSGLKGTPSYQAAQEWFVFLKDYDSDGSIETAAFQGNPEEQFPETYLTYHIYSQEMEDKLKDLADKYNLKLLGAPMEFQSMGGLTRAVGIDHVLNPGSEVKAYFSSGTCYPGGNFDISMHVNMPDGEGMWNYTILAQLVYCRKDCLSTAFQYLDANKEWKEWNYVTPSGSNVLILRAPTGNAYLFCDCGDSTMTLIFEAGYNPLTDDPDFQPEWMTDRQVEQVADAFDFSIRPTLPDASAASRNDHARGWDIQTKAVYFDGTAGKLVFHLTAPRGTDLHSEEGNSIYPSNWDDEMLFSDSGKINIGFWTYGSADDGDGKKNTADLEYIFVLQTPDDPDFPANGICTAHIEDLTMNYWNGLKDIEEIAAEGVWELEFSFDDCDKRVIECLQSPISLNLSGPSRSDGRRQVTVKSIQLSNLGAYVRFEGDEVPLVHFHLEIVMKDGSTVRALDEGNYLLADEVIDLDQVAYLRIDGGTVITVP